MLKENIRFDFIKIKYKFKMRIKFKKKINLDLFCNVYLLSYFSHRRQITMILKLGKERI